MGENQNAQFGWVVSLSYMYVVQQALVMREWSLNNMILTLEIWYTLTAIEETSHAGYGIKPGHHLGLNNIYSSILCC